VCVYLLLFNETIQWCRLFLLQLLVIRLCYWGERLRVRSGRSDRGGM
jgi:hypothetical protein